MCVLKVKVISLPYIFKVLYVLCFTGPRYQVSVYRTIGPLVVLMALLTFYYPFATFQKAGTCLDAQQSIAKQPIKGCVSNQNRTSGKSVSEKSE